MNRDDVMKKKEKRRPIRFFAMSKLLGVVVICMAISIVIYSMYEMHINKDLSPLNYLIMSIFGLLASYIGFYINMAKAEHLEDKKNQIKKELELLHLNGIQEDEKERAIELQNKLEKIREELNSLDTVEEVNTREYIE